MVQASRKTRSNTTRNKIIEKAERLLWRQGYESTSLNDVVAKAGVSKGAFFHYYPNKQAISRDIIHKYAQDYLLAPLRTFLAQEASPKEGLLAWVQHSFNEYKDRKFSSGCLLGNLALELADHNEVARETMKQHFLEWENLLTSQLKPLAEQGKMLIEPRQFARLLIAAYQGVMMTIKVHKDPNRAGREFMALAQMIEYMIKD